VGGFSSLTLDSDSDVGKPQGRMQCYSCVPFVPWHVVFAVPIRRHHIRHQRYPVSRVAAQNSSDPGHHITRGSTRGAMLSRSQPLVSSCG